MTRWHQFYRDDPRVLTAPASHCAARARSLFQHYHVQRVLDLGCGVGRDTFFLAPALPQIIGVDRALEGLAHAQRDPRASSIQIPWICADARALPFPPATFDGVYCYGVLHEFTSATAEADVAAIMDTISTLLTHDGILILAVLAGDPCAGLPHVQLFTTKMFLSITQAYTCLNYDRYTDCGCTGSTDYRIHYGCFVKR